MLAVLAVLTLPGATVSAQSPAPRSPAPYFEFQVEKPAAALKPPALEYPPLLRSARVEGTVLAQFVVDDSGHYVPDTFRVLRSSHDLFTQVVAKALPGMKFSPAMIGGRSVAQLVQQPFTFSLTSDSTTAAPKVLDARIPSFPAEAFRPEVVKFGASLASLQRELQNVCVWMTTRRIDPPFKVLGDIRDKQYQIDCEGFWFAGKQRHAEFVVADDALEMVWIMTDRANASTIQNMMSRSYGESDAQNDKFYSFTRGHAALRIDVPEVLFYSERLAPRVKEWFGPNSTF